MPVKGIDKLEASVAKLGQSQQALLDLGVWVPLQAIEAQLKAAVASINQLRVYRDQVENHKQSIDDAFKEVQDNSQEFMSEIEAVRVHQAQEEAKKQADMPKELADPKDICTFNVGAHTFKIRREILLKSPGSKLMLTMQKAEERGGDLVIDRDPERFRNVLNFLRDDFKTPQLSTDKLAEVIDELRFWEVDKIPQIGHAPQKEERKEEQKQPDHLVDDPSSLLSRPPGQNLSGINPGALQSKKQLGPLLEEESSMKPKASFPESFPIKKRQTPSKYSHYKDLLAPMNQDPFQLTKPFENAEVDKKSSTHYIMVVQKSDLGFSHIEFGLHYFLDGLTQKIRTKADIKVSLILISLSCVEQLFGYQYIDYKRAFINRKEIKERFTYYKVSDEDQVLDETLKVFLENKDDFGQTIVYFFRNYDFSGYEGKITEFLKVPGVENKFRFFGVAYGEEDMPRLKRICQEMPNGDFRRVKTEQGIKKSMLRMLYYDK